MKQARLLAIYFLVVAVLACSIPLQINGDLPPPTPDPSYLVQLTALANARETAFAQSTMKPVARLLSVQTQIGETLAFSPDGTLLATAGKTVNFWDVNTLEPVGVSLETNAIAVWSIAFSPDGEILAVNTCQKASTTSSACEQYEIHLWDVKTQQLLQPSLSGYQGASFAFNADGKLIAAVDRDAVALWDIASRTLTDKLSDNQIRYISDVAFSPDGKLLAAGTGMTVSLWDVATRKPVGTPLSYSNRGNNQVAFSPDGKTIFAMDSSETWYGWDVSTGQLTSAAGCYRGNGYGFAFSPDGKFLALSGYENTVLLFDFRTQSCVSVPTNDVFNSDYINSVAISPNGTLLAAGSSNGTVVILDISTYK